VARSCGSVRQLLVIIGFSTALFSTQLGQATRVLRASTDTVPSLVLSNHPNRGVPLTRVSIENDSFRKLFLNKS
jgi:hypothetical protein